MIKPCIFYWGSTEGSMLVYMANLQMELIWTKLSSLNLTETSRWSYLQLLFEWCRVRWWESLLYYLQLQNKEVSVKIISLYNPYGYHIPSVL
jgi:hypothetical protein